MLAEQRITSDEVVTPEPVPVGVRRSAHYFPEIESLRGIAILLVVLFHANGFVAPPADPPGSRVSLPWAFIAAGATGVSLFFVLSGFLLSLPFVAEAAGGKPVRRADYYARRALRILPLYYAAVLLASILSAHSLVDLLRGVPFLFFLNSFTHTKHLTPYSDVWWSLGTEIQFYLVLPLLPLFLRNRPGRWAGVAVLCGYAIILVLLLTGRIPLKTSEGANVAKLSLLGRGFSFLFGGVAAWIYFHYGARVHERLARIRAMTHGGADAALIVTLIGLSLLLRWQVFFGYWNAEAGLAHLWHVLETFLWAVIVLLLLLAPIRMKPVFCNRALSAVGILSYSLYIVHLPLIRLSFGWLHHAYPRRFVGWGIEGCGAIAVLVVACLALSGLTYRVIERPFLRRKARLDR